MAGNERPTENRDEGRSGEAGGAEPPMDIRLWKDMFIRPRVTVRWLLERETARSALMQWLAFTSLFMIFVFVALILFPEAFEYKVTKMELVVATPVVFLLSWGYFVFVSYLFCILSRLVGGRCEFWEMQVVNAFTTVIPGIVFGGVRFGLFLLFGKGGLAGSLMDNAVMIWSGYITLSGISVAAGITVWRALVVYFVSVGVWLGVIMASVFVMKALFG